MQHNDVVGVLLKLFSQLCEVLKIIINFLRPDFLHHHFALQVAFHQFLDCDGGTNLASPDQLRQNPEPPIVPVVALYHQDRIETFFPLQNYFSVTYDSEPPKPVHDHPCKLLQSKGSLVLNLFELLLPQLDE